MSLMWACEVIMVCDKRWVVDCGVCILVDQILFFTFLRMYTLVFTLDVLLQFSDAIAGLGNVIWVDPINT